MQKQTNQQSDFIKSFSDKRKCFDMMVVKQTNNADFINNFCDIKKC